MTGCASYRPLYGKGPSGEGVTSSLAAVAVPEQPTRSAQLVRNELLNSMGSAPAKFSLKLLVTEKTVDVSTLSASNLRRKRFNLVVHYELVNISSGAVSSSGDSFSNVSFDTVRQPIADLQAANNAMERAAQEVGQDLRQRVAAYFADRPV
jgi:LPS-assembly lipoprotein